MRVSPIPPVTGEKQGGQDTARTNTAGRALPGRTGRGREGGGNSGLQMHLGWRGSAFQNGLRAGGIFYIISRCDSPKPRMISQSSQNFSGQAE